MQLESVESLSDLKNSKSDLGSILSERENATPAFESKLSMAKLPSLEFFSEPKDQAQKFHRNERDREFDKFAESFSLNSEKFGFSYKNSGSTIGLKISNGSDSVAKWSPKNGTSDPEAQEVSHKLAQYLNVSDRVSPSAYYDLTGPALDRFRNMVQNTTEKDDRRANNRETILRALDETPNGIQGVVTPWIPTITEVKGLSKATDVYGSFNTEHPIAALIQADGPMPGNDEMILQTNKGALSAPENQLAKEFSQIMVVDILCGQYDRFNGSNLEATYDPQAGLHFFARDNGGASMNSEGKTQEYFKILSRFDRDQINKVEDLLKELNGPKAKSLTAELHLQSDPKHLRERAAALIEHVNSLRKQHGDDKVFFRQ